MGLGTLAWRSPGPPSGPRPPLFEIVLVSCWEQGTRRDGLAEEREDVERIGATTEEFVGVDGLADMANVRAKCIATLRLHLRDESDCG